MTWSGFRPSDDACEYHYLIPANCFAAVILGELAAIAREAWQDEAFALEALRVRREIVQGSKHTALSTTHALAGYMPMKRTG